MNDDLLGTDFNTNAESGGTSYTGNKHCMLEKIC